MGAMASAQAEPARPNGQQLQLHVVEARAQAEPARLATELEAAEKAPATQLAAPQLAADLLPLEAAALRAEVGQLRARLADAERQVRLA